METACETQSSPPPLESLKPAYYYGGLDEGSGVPVFKPSMEEFRDFNQFVQRIDSYGQRSGLVKVIPPAEWRAAVRQLNLDKLKSIRINSAIHEHFTGSSGIYTQLNVMARRKMSLLEWRQLSDSAERRPPRPVDQGASNSEPSCANRSSRSDSAADSTVKEKIKLATDTDMGTETIKPSPPPSNMKNPKSGVKSRHAGSVAKSKLAPLPPLEAASYDDFVPRSPFPCSADYLKQLERHYWKNVSFTSPMYGADIPGSLFNPKMDIWNVARLDNLLNRMQSTIPGVNSPYLYFGMWKATFAWHLEDMDLFSINYIHFGAPKWWYVIPPNHYERFERLTRHMYPAEFQLCSQFLRHKVVLMSPTFLATHNIPVNRCLQEEGEFMLTFPYGYHAGYNLGYNCAESVNFALPRWIEIGKRSMACACVRDSVRIDVGAVFEGKPGAAPAVAHTFKSAVAMRTLRDIPKMLLCVICGRWSDYGELLPVDGNSTRRVHRICAEFLPELYIVSFEDHDHVSGLEHIPKARWTLRCKFCNYRKGACIQCCRGQCVSSYHPTCAAEEDLCMRVQEHSDFDLFETFCKRHDPRLDLDRRCSTWQHLNSVASYLNQPTGHSDRTVWCRWLDGKYYAGRVEIPYPEQETCLVEFAVGAGNDSGWLTAHVNGEQDGYVKLVRYCDLCLTMPPVENQGSLTMDADTADREASLSTLS